MKIAMINIYQGGLPGWLSKFIDQVNLLKNFSWTLIHFCGESYVRGNFRMLKVSYDSLDAITLERLGIKITWKGARDRRKIGELRPTFAKLFPDLVRGFDWWGYYDLDVVFGKLNWFFTDALLTNFETASASSMDKWSGPFQLVKNVETTNNLFMNHPDWRHLITNPKYNLFDEDVMGGLSKKARIRSLHIPQWQAHDRMRGHPNLKMIDGHIFDVVNNRTVCMFHFPRTKRWPLIRR